MSVPITYHILNEKNKYITQEFINLLLIKYGIKKIKIKNMNNFQIAMTHETYMTSYVEDEQFLKLLKEKKLQADPITEEYLNSVIPLQKESYERLEYLGDSIIHAVIAKYLFSRYSDQEGFLTRLRTKIENGTVLSDLSKILELPQFVLIGRNLEILNARATKNDILEDIFEAFIGALFLESDFQTCYSLVVQLIEENIDFADLIFVETNYKDMLLRYYHQKHWPDPEYGLKELVETKEDEGDTKKRTFKMFVKGYVPNKNGDLVWDIIGYGTGTSKKTGEQLAAKDALVLYGVITNEENSVEIYNKSDLNYS